MRSATVTPPRPAAGTQPRARAVPWPALALLALSVATLIGFLVYPTYPNYDSYYSLLWGREVLHGHLPSFEAYRAPTEHPLAIAFGGLLSLIGTHADRVMVFCTEASFVVLCAGVYRFGRAVFTPLVGLIAAAILVTRFDFPFLAARAYIDIPFLAFVVWAAALEVERPRRGGIVWVLLACAGLLRPEAWLLLSLYFLWMSSGDVSWGTRARYAAIAAIAPFTWLLVDFAVTGHPLFSLQHTSGLAEELGRTKGLSEVPGAMRRFFFNLVKAPVLWAGLAGAAAAIWFVPRRVALPAVLWLVGTLTFVLVGVAGLSVIDRYLLVPALMTMLFAAVAIGGWTMLREGTTSRRVWAAAAGLVVAYGVVFTLTHVTLSRFDSELVDRGNAHQAMRRLLADPDVRAARRCGPVSTPNHKLIPEARWILGAGEHGVVARSDRRQRHRIRRGVAIYVTDRTWLLRYALGDPSDDPLDSVPMDGFRPAAHTGFYSAYVRG
jgi:hypothetical protein